MAENKRKPHAIMISVSYQGHINPYVNLALKIASRGFTITFVHLDYVHHKLSKSHGSTSEFDLFSEVRKSGLDIRYTTISDGLPIEYDRDGDFVEYWKYFLPSFGSRADEFIGKMIESDPTWDYFLVIDTVYWWTGSVADKYNLVSVSFWTEPALVLSLGYHWELMKEKGHLPCEDNTEVQIDYIPGVESISTKDIMSYATDPNPDIITELLLKAYDNVKKADFILLNTVHELEPQTLSTLNKYQPNYAVGPINFSKNLPTNTISRSLWSQSDCTHWLDQTPPGSVLYISFGSIVHANKKLIQELAHGLVLSGVNFIWVVRDGGSNIFPDGYDENKGLIVPWCNQIKVLSHPAVGGFLTHNGWNSTVESMWCGVPMICCPVMWDQLTNRKLVVDDWKIGVHLLDGTSIDRNEIAEKMREFMSNDGSLRKRLRHEADRVKGILKNAVDVDGSSERNFDQFIQDLMIKIHANTA